MVNEITLDELRGKIEAGDDFILAEVLPSDYYAEAHLPRAVNLPLDRLEALAPELTPAKPVVLRRLTPSGAVAYAYTWSRQFLAMRAATASASAAPGGSLRCSPRSRLIVWRRFPRTVWQRWQKRT